MSDAEYDLRELSTVLCHDQWSGWMKYEFSKGTFNDDGTWTMPAWAVERWQRQLNTPYKALSEDEQSSDKDEADRFLHLLELHLLDGQDRNMIISKTINLKQSDGEGWAIGQFIQRILQEPQ